jgi:hypothetical protein
MYSIYRSIGRFRPLLRIASVVGFAVLFNSTFGQGCMATRVSPPMVDVSESSQYLQPGQWETSESLRHYEAKRHFHDYNEENVPANAPRVMRTILDTSITRMLTSTTSVTVSIPYQWGSFDRSPIPPYTGSKDTASGLGDIAVTFRKWILDPATHATGNLRLGLGIKCPTGDYHQDTNRLVNTAPAGSPQHLVWERGPADIAIQPGDGGWGLIFGAEGFRRIKGSAMVYGELTYLSNPRGNNGVNNQWSGAGPYVPDRVTSVPDYFLTRAGLAFGEPLGWHRGSFQIGLRAEGQPVRDLIGNASGFRRPGCTLSVEPGFGYGFGQWTAFFSLPVTIERVRWLSVDERQAGRKNAVSAAFADYNFIGGVSRRW